MGDTEENSIIEALKFSYSHDMGDAQLPTNEELITHYLNRKVLEKKFIGRAIAKVDQNKCDPK